VRSKVRRQDTDPRDKRKVTFPEIAFDPTFAEYVAGSDSALSWALTAPTPASIQDELKASLGGGLDSVLARYRGFVGEPKHKYLPDPEGAVNALGYSLLAEKRIPDAIVIFEVNARTHPSSANAFDSLGEGYANARDASRALSAYKKSLALNPKNANAQRMITEIETAGRR
jgi:tetratricopeptide (TPR) repeat protein